jgi:hypothetical protein
MDPFVALMRRYVNDYTNRHDTSVCPDLMEPDYTLRMGPHVVGGRDERYVPAAQKQFTQFPGLCLTVHEIVCNGDRLAMRFSEHGASVRHGGAVASWQGIGLYRWNGTKLVENLVEQDYQARRRQLADGVPDPVAAPALAPWDTAAVPAAPAAEQVVRDWIADGAARGAVRVDDGDKSVLQEEPSDVVDDLFSAGSAVAFRITRDGRYAGGLDGVDPALVGAPSRLHMVGVVHVADGRVAGGQIIRDRLGMARSLTSVGVTT